MPTARWAVPAILRNKNKGKRRKISASPLPLCTEARKAAKGTENISPDIWSSCRLLKRLHLFGLAKFGLSGAFQKARWLPAFIFAHRFDALIISEGMAQLNDTELNLCCVQGILCKKGIAR